jgi:hypothetical protein
MTGVVIIGSPSAPIRHVFGSGQPNEYRFTNASSARVTEGPRRLGGWEPFESGDHRHRYWSRRDTRGLRLEPEGGGFVVGRIHHEVVVASNPSIPLSFYGGSRLSYDDMRFHLTSVCKGIIVRDR